MNNKEIKLWIAVYTKNHNVGHVVACKLADEAVEKYIACRRADEAIEKIKARQSIGFYAMPPRYEFEALSNQVDNTKIFLAFTMIAELAHILYTALT